MNALALELGRSLRWLLLGFGVLVPVTAAALVRVMLAPERGSEVAAVVEAAPRCEPTRLDEEACPGGTHCIAGRCEVLRREVRRGEGEACGAGLCSPGLECFRGGCVAPDDLPVVADACRPEAVRSAVTYLRSQCGARMKAPAASLRDCTAEAWRDFSATDPQFEHRLGALPGVFSVHFERDRPDPQLRWATPEVRGELRRQLGAHRSALVPADQVLVIGRASVEGDLEKNRALAERRAALTEELLRVELAEALPRTQRWGLAHEHALAPEGFKVDVRATPVAWTRSEADRLAAALAPEVDLRELPAETWRWLQHTINRVALVVPLYCDGTEYYPTPAFQGAEEASGA